MDSGYLRKIIGLLLIAVSFRFTSADPCICDNGYRPTCATDGRTYQNECRLACWDVNNRERDMPGVSAVYPGPCPPLQCPCAPDNQRVCASNGLTFDNLCRMQCDNKRRTALKLPLITKDYLGPCIPFNCQDNLVPVCGSDGKTYKNECFRKFANDRQYARNPLLPPIFTKTTGGPCLIDTCNCLPDSQKVCGSDGVTYPNQCQLDCAIRKTEIMNSLPKKLKFDYKGPCVGCTCNPLPNQPVCGSDGKSYPNSACLVCENLKNKLRGLIAVVPLYKGQCFTCSCGNYLDPVCASDGKTYRNECFAECENIRRYYSGIYDFLWWYGGACLCQCPCLKNPPLACGNDGVTYWNDCWLNCVSVCNQKSGQKPVQKVKTGFCNEF